MQERIHLTRAAAIQREIATDRGRIVIRQLPRTGRAVQIEKPPTEPEPLMKYRNRFSAMLTAVTPAHALDELLLLRELARLFFDRERERRGREQRALVTGAAVGAQTELGAGLAPAAFVKNRSMPRICARSGCPWYRCSHPCSGLRLPGSSAHWSYGASSEISVRTYTSWIASPQISEKFASICVYSSVPDGAPRADLVLVLIEQLVRIPEAVRDRVLDQVGIRDAVVALAVEAVFRVIRQRAEHAVARMHALAGQRLGADHLLAELQEIAVASVIGSGHLEITDRRGRRLRGQARGVLERNLDRCDIAALVAALVRARARSCCAGRTGRRR